MKAGCLLSLPIGGSLFAMGCASPKRTVVSTNGLGAAPLRPGERITIEFGFVDSPPTNYLIDTQGFVTFYPAHAVQVAGLPPADAAEKIRQTVVPRYYRKLSVIITKVQPKD